MTPGPDEISVLVANPQAMARELLMGALNRYGKFNPVHCASTSQEILDVVKSTVVNVALISASLADGPLSGFGAMRQIRECCPEVRSVILLNVPERNVVVDAFRAGAKGVFSLSQSGFKSLCRCVEQVHSGQIWANSRELSEVMESFAQLGTARVMNIDGLRLLTKREEDVVRLVAEGMPNRDIANVLKLSEHTIRNYLFHIFDKLGVSSRIELALYAVSRSNKIQPTDVHNDEQQMESPADLQITGKSAVGPKRGSSMRVDQVTGQKQNQIAVRA